MIEGVNLVPQLLSNNNDVHRPVAEYVRQGNYEPYEYYIVWSCNGIGYLGVANVANPSAVSIINKYTDVNSISICSQGSWVRHASGFKFITEHEPIVALIKSDGSLYIHDRNIDEHVTFDGNYSMVAITRGWKSLIDDTDMGIIVAASYGRNLDIYCKVGAYNLIETLTVSEDIIDVTITRLADYRVCVSIHTINNTYHYYTDRNYIGGAVQPDIARLDNISVYDSSNILTHIASTYNKHEFEPCYLNSIEYKSSAINMEWCTQPVLTNIFGYNISDTEIMLYIPALFIISEDLHKYMTILDDNDNYITVLSATKQDGSYLKITCAKFNNYVGDFKLNVATSNSLQLTSGTDIVSFNTIIKVSGLIPDDIEPPKVISILNLEVT